MTDRLSPPETRRPPQRPVRIQAGPRPLPELLSLAAAASRSGMRVDFVGLEDRSVEDVIRLAVAGGDAVSFTADRRPAALPVEAPRTWPFLRLLALL